MRIVSWIIGMVLTGLVGIVAAWGQIGPYTPQSNPSSNQSPNVSGYTQQFFQMGLVAALPACNASTEGMMVVVTNAAATPVYNATAAGGGTVVIPVLCNGANWVNH